ncbi:hypothetical protein KORDIASMS9_03750 [Kordia sp. SMS9]|uniref:class I lanthipeptide n=1 Tax=Kordia sp. SMS9 TaxID=2282170 RepID=UPI000E10D3D8|nr:class I lanthipeptide [Kordia sp. SMS9]AXG71493.1 hypothetical protein KORDIASMS9_03750 [Kordia sp. SMS9]
MKKKNVSKLSLNKKAISRLDANTPKGGQATPLPTPPVPISVPGGLCATQNNQCPSSVVYWCNVSCYIC